MKTKFGILTVLLVLALAGCAGKPSHPDAKEGWYPNIVDYAYVAEHAVIPVRSDVVVIDSRPKARKYDEEHIPGAISIPEMSFDKMVDQLPADKSVQLIFYCGGVDCMLSHKSAFKAEKLGYSNIKVYADGMPDWVKRGGMTGVDVAYVKKLMDSGEKMMLIDARPKARKYDKGHIPTAISLPDSDFEKMTGSLPADKNFPLYFYCEGPDCKLSASSAAKAVKLGYTKVYQVPGGYPAWKKAYGDANAKPIVIQKGKDEGTITVASVRELMEDAPETLMLIDVRDADEFKRASIKGAVNIPINSLEGEIDKLPTDKTIVFFCGTGGRAGEAYDMVKMFRPNLKMYFMNAEVKFKGDGSYTMKDL